MGAKGESSAQIPAQSWDVPLPAAVISVGQEEVQLAGRTSVELMAAAGSHLSGQGLGAVEAARTPRLSVVAAMKGAQLEEDRGQAMHSHLFHRTMGSPVWGCSGHSPAS